MAEIICKYDTKTKKFEVSKDGKNMENVSRCSFGKGYDGDDYMCSIDMVKRDKDEGTSEINSLYASKDKLDKVNQEVNTYIANYKK
jgi:hypothetical protein